MSRRLHYGRAQYNFAPDTRPGGTGEFRANDPKRPGGSAAATPERYSRKPKTPRRLGGEGPKR